MSSIRVAALYDIHGNLPALEAVLQDVHAADVDLIVVGGDAVLGPMPRETLEYLLDTSLPIQFIQGNCEREMLTQLAGGDPTSVPPAFRAIMRWVGDQLLPEHRQVIASWPVAVQVEIPGLGDVLFCHATPRSDTECFTRHTPEDRLRPVFLFDAVRTRRVQPSEMLSVDPDLRTLRNLNTPDDYRAALADAGL